MTKPRWWRLRLPRTRAWPSWADADSWIRAQDLDCFFGTLAPRRRASDKPIAIACLRLVTFLPDRPLRSVPRLRLCIARFTFFCAVRPYLATSRHSAVLYGYRPAGFVPRAGECRPPISVVACGATWYGYFLAGVTAGAVAAAARSSARAPLRMLCSA